VGDQITKLEHKTLSTSSLEQYLAILRKLDSLFKISAEADSPPGYSQIFCETAKASFK